MKKGAFILFVVLLFAVGCKNGQSVVDTSLGWELELRKGGCLDNCKSYTIAINEQGGYTYAGKYNVPIQGAQSGELSKAVQQQLMARIKAVDWGVVKDQYGNEAEDSQRKTLTYKDKNTNKTIVYWRLEPLEIRTLESFIDSIITTHDF